MEGEIKVVLALRFGVKGSGTGFGGLPGRQTDRLRRPLQESGWLLATRRNALSFAPSEILICFASTSSFGCKEEHEMLRVVLMEWRVSTGSGKVGVAFLSPPPHEHAFEILRKVSLLVGVVAKA